MAWTSYDLPEALALCDYAPTHSDAVSCQTGVFMENGVAGRSGVMGHRSEYIDPTDPHYPCNTVQARFVDACYTFQTSIMVVHGYGYDQVAAAPEGRNRGACLNGAAQNLFWDPSGGEPARAFCAVTHLEDQGGCYETIIQRASELLPPLQRDAFCAALPGEWPTQCLRYPEP